MRTKNNRLGNFILETSQLMLVFLGVFSAMMCFGYGLELTFDRGWCALVMFLASILFYGLFSVLETMKRGKLWGIVGVTMFCIALIVKFFDAFEKGFVTMVNSFLKALMNFSGAKISLVSYKNDMASVRFGTNLMLIVLGAYIIVIISAFFYRRRKSGVFIGLTVPFAIIPMFVGRLGYFSNLFTYLMVLFVVFGTRHLKTDAADKRLRQKLSLILIIVGLVSGGISYLVMPPERYDANENRLVQMKNSIKALNNWSGDEVSTWVKTYFSGDAIAYGKIGKKNEVNYNGSVMLKLSGDINMEHNLYLKGFVGDKYENNRWESYQENEEYLLALEQTASTGNTVENWFNKVRSDVGDSEGSDVENVWQTGKLHVRNIAFGYGNYLIPYSPLSGFKYQENGRTISDNLGVEYDVEYYTTFPIVMKQEVIYNQYTLAPGRVWENNKDQRKTLEDFAKKYYLQMPDSVKNTCDKFKKYLKEEKNDLLTKYNKGTANITDIIRAVKQYITKDTEYTLAPGKVPSDKESVEYFLDENKKGYCIYYATAATMLLRSCGIPTRYVEGMLVPKDMFEGTDGEKEVEVVDSCAHAWIEIYQNQYGFVPIEVTPGLDEDGFGNNEKKQKDKKKKNETKNNDIKEEPEKITPTPKVSETPEESMTFDDIDGNEDAPEETAEQKQQKAAKKMLWRIIYIIIGIIVLAVFMEILRRIRKRMFINNLKSHKYRRQISLAHRRISPILHSRGAVYTGQPMSEYAKSISEATDMPYDQILEYVSVIYHARFGPDTITTEQRVVFRDTYNEIVKHIYGTSKFFTKLFYMYIKAL